MASWANLVMSYALAKSSYSVKNLGSFEVLVRWAAKIFSSEILPYFNSEINKFISVLLYFNEFL